jgi:hypothetical protein
MLLRSARSLTRSELLIRPNILAKPGRLYSTAPSLPFLSSTRPFAKPRAVQPVTSECFQPSQRRCAKRKATLTLEDIQQGAIETDALPPQDDAEPDYPPLLQQVRNNMLKFSHCVLVTRVGGFYEVGASRRPCHLC